MLPCDLVLRAQDVVQKRILLAGSDSSRLTIDCNGATLDGGVGRPNDGKDMIDIRSLPPEGAAPRGRGSGRVPLTSQYATAKSSGLCVSREWARTVKQPT